jgi:energy-coupling factor transporter ATP-binding protein EcfA2
VPLDARFDLADLAANPYVRETLDATGLTDELVEVGYRLAQTMLELFADLPPDHEYFRQFSFIAPEELPEYKALVGRADHEQQRPGSLLPGDRARLMALPFRLIPARHRLGLLTPETMDKVVAARHRFRERLPAALEGAIAFFEPDAYNRPSSIQDNIVFGKIAYAQSGAAARITPIIGEVLDGLRLRERVIQVGLDFGCGVGGGRLSPAQRQKLAVARAVLRRPEIMVMHDSVGALDPQEQVRLRDGLIQEFDGRTLVWAVQQEEWAERFDQVLDLDLGRVLPAELYAGGGAGEEREEEDERAEPPAAPMRELAAAS